ncbi:MAG: hypothetical protein AAFZ15_22540 [Bacteroidota bacterium]
MTPFDRSFSRNQDITLVFLPLMAFLLLTISNLHAQSKYTGKLIKQKNEKAAIGVELRVVGSEDITFTDINGKFMIYDYGDYTDSVVVEVVDSRFEKSQFTAYPYVFSTIRIAKRKERWKPALQPVVPDDTYHDPALIHITPDQSYISTPPHAALLFQHTVPGMTVTQPGSDPNGYYQIINRGLSSVMQRNYPLVIVDGMPEMSLERLNPEDIQMMSVGKTATTGAAYGMMGGAGVIQLQTMRYDTAMPTLRYHTSLSGGFGEVGVPVMDADEYLNYKAAYDEGHDTDWQRAIMRNAYSHRHHLSLATGTERKGIYASLSHQNENGILRSSGFQQNQGRLNMHTTSRSGRTTLSMTGSITQRDADMPNTRVFSRAVFYNPTRAVYDANGELTTTPSGNRIVPNPVGYITDHKTLARTQEWTAGMHLEHRTSKNWDWDYLVSMRRRKFFTGDLSVGFNRRMSHVASQRKHTFAKIGLRKKYQLKNATLRHWTAIETSLLTERIGFLYAGNLDSVNVDFDFVTDPLSILNEENEFNEGDIVDHDKKMASGNIGGSLEFDYFQLSGGLRYDRLFIGGGNNGRWFYHGRATADLKPLLTPAWINRSQLSLGFGKTGLAPSADGVTRQNNVNVWGGEYIPRRFLSDDYLNEEKTEIDLQLDLSFLEDRLSATINVYNQSLSDQLLGFYEDAEIGIRGWEVLLNYQLLQGKQLNWRSTFSFSSYKTSIYSYGDEPDPAVLGIALNEFDYGEIYLEHLGPVGQIRGYRTDGTIANSGRYLPLDLDGDFFFDRVTIGQVHPSFGIAWTSQLKYGPWDGSFRLRSIIGHDLINTYRYSGEMVNATDDNIVNATDFNKDRLRVESEFYDIFVENASFLKLDLLVLGFSPRIKKAHLRFYLMGENLLTFSKFTGIDPEPRYQRDGIALAGGMEEMDQTYFRSKRITIGAQLALK